MATYSIDSIKIGNDTFNLAGGNPSDVNNSSACVIIPNRAYEYDSTITSISLSNVLHVGENAFYDCSKLTSVNLPNARIINKGAFNYCTELTSVNISNARIVDNYAFGFCSKLVSVLNTKCLRYIGDFAFVGCEKLSTIDGQYVYYIGSNAFADCSLFNYTFPNVEII